MADTYTVYVYDLNTNTKVAELSAKNLRFDSRLNDAGACSFDLKLDDVAVKAQSSSFLSYNGAPTAIYVDRDGTIVWPGIAWQWQYQDSTGMLTIGAKEFPSYFTSRVIAADYTAAGYPSGIDPAQLVYKALTDAQNSTLCGPGASVGLTVTGGTSSIPAIIPGYSQSQYTTVAQVISDVTAAATPGAGGVDVSITAQWSNGQGSTPTLVAAIDSPRCGRVAGVTGLVFDLGQSTDFTWPSDATQSGTRIYAIGSGTGSAQAIGLAQSAQPVGGLGQYPRLDLVISYAQVQSQQHLNAIANGDAATYGQAVTSPTVTIPTAYGPNALGSWLIGDDARLHCDIGHPRFPSGLDQYWRIVQHTVTVPDSGASTVTLTFNTPPVY